MKYTKWIRWNQFACDEFIKRIPIKGQLTILSNDAEIEHWDYDNGHMSWRVLRGQSESYGYLRSEVIESVNKALAFQIETN